MKKSNLVLLVVVVVLAIIVVILFFRNKHNPKSVLRDFAVEDTASINKIFLADKNNNSVKLEKIDGVWFVNDTYRARKDFVNVLLTTMKNVEVNAPVPEARLDKVLKELSVKGIKTEIYQDDKLTKTYYVGGVTQNNTGTYMILEGSDVPFIMHIPGFAGYLTVRYLPDVKEWRERIIFDYQFKDIAKVSVSYGKNQSDGFVLHNYGDNKYGINMPDESNVSFMVDTVAIKEYLSAVKFIAYETLINEDLQEHKLDSLSKEPMVAKYEVEDRKGNLKSFKTYYRQNVNYSVDEQGVPYDWDVDRLYGIVNDGTEVVFLQYYVLDPITKTIYDFDLNRPKPKPLY
ncbi:MAG: DUF4340 domain-containing protein [Bacteroidales bacterium]|nr:DUF4340 domain-containing protein [Bacteroidales bacterium]